MQFILGVVITIAFFVCAFVAYKEGQRSNAPAEVSKQEDAEIERLREKGKRNRKSFDQMMEYSVETALGRKVE